LKAEDLMKDVVRQLMNNKEFVKSCERMDELSEEIAKLVEEQVEIMSEILMVPKRMVVDLHVSSVLDRITAALINKFGEDAVADGIVEWYRTKVDRRAMDNFLKAYREAMKVLEELKEEEIDG